MAYANPPKFPFGMCYPVLALTARLIIVIVFLPILSNTQHHHYMMPKISENSIRTNPDNS